MGASLAVARSMKNLISEIPDTDLSTLAGMTALLAGVRLLAWCVPAWRAARIEPVVALRQD
jgi:ABC-type lipoprotein release transport system permease subunit